MSPTELTLKQLRAEGYTARVVEQTVHAPGRVFKRDCFGYDVLAAREETFGRNGCGDVVGIQACAASSHAARVAKLLANPEARVFVASRKARIEVWSWSTRRSEERTKAGKRSKRLVHHLRREEITLAMFVPQQAFSEGGGAQEQPLCIVCWLPATRGLPEDGGKLYWCGKHGPFYDKPDSDEREADRICGHVDSAWMCVKVAGHSGTHVCETRNLAIAGVVSIRHSLAQRILAALEGKLTPDGYEESAVLAAELRAIVERKP